MKHLKLFEQFDDEFDDPFGEEIKSTPINKVVIKKYKFNDGGSYNGYRYFVFSDTLILRCDLRTLKGDINRHHFADDGGFAHRCMDISPTDIELIKNDTIWIGNDYGSGGPNYYRWKYSDMVKVFGENNIIL